jgi:hypothetical protein
MRDTIDMAREAGFHVMTDPLFGDAWLAHHHESNFYKFEALIRADEREIEREACAEECLSLSLYGSRSEKELEAATMEDCAAAIRARGETK